jgi:ribosomal protein S27E
MKCYDCGEELLQGEAKRCPYCGGCHIVSDSVFTLKEQKELEEQKKQIEIFMKSGRYEEAARLYDKLEMYEKAGECRRLAKTTYQISTNFSLGRDGTISVSCPTCGSTQAIESKSNNVTCAHCGNNYVIPKKILDMM